MIKIFPLMKVKISKTESLVINKFTLKLIYAGKILKKRKIES